MLSLEKKFKTFKRKINNKLKKTKKVSETTENDNLVQEKKELYIPKFLIDGETFTLFDEMIEPTTVTIYYNPELQRLVFSKIDSDIDLESIEEVRYGGEGQDWAWRYLYKYNNLRLKTMIIVFKKKGNYIMYNLAAETEEIAKDWVSGIRDYLIAYNDDFEFNKLNGLIDNKIWMKRAWNIADTNNNNSVSEKEIKEVLKVLNIKMNSYQRKRAFNKINTESKNAELDFDEFVNFFKNLDDRSDVKPVFDQYKSGNSEYMDINGFKKFLTECQMESFTEAEIKKYYNEYKSSENGMNLEDFVNYLLSTENSLQKFEEIDDSLPLNDYFMASSHNTYLVGNQLAGSASVEGYVRCIQRGCRCIEIDCWDGPNNEPKATHGMTLTGNILVKDVLKAVAIYGFKKTPYPMLLSLENHCSIEQQVVMANEIREILGDKVLLNPVMVNDTLPKLSDLKFKVIVKVEFKLSLTMSMKLGTDAAIPMEEHTGNPETDDEDSDGEDLKHIQLEENGEDDDDDAQNYADLSEDVNNEKKYPVSLELAAMTIYCKSKPFKSIDLALESAKYEYACCVSEAASVKLYKERRADYISVNQIQMTRVYPVGKRIISSNYNPVPHWLCGSQIVALNYQTFDKGTDINDAMYFQNNYLGYIPKPIYIRSGIKFEPLDVYHRLNVEVISAQKLVKPKSKEDGDIVDSQITVEMFGDSVLKEGNPESCIDDEIKNKFRTKICKDNGFNPLFNEKTSFTYKNPEIAFLRIKVNEYNLLKKQCIGTFTFPVSKLKSGYRQITLRDRYGDPLPFSTVLIKISHENNIIRK